MSYECFDVEVSDHVAHLVLKRGDQLNTMVPTFWYELPEIVTGISEKGEARAIVLSSTGKHFCAGMDLAVFTGGSGNFAGGASSELGRQRAHVRLAVKKLQDSFSALEQARVPVLAAIQGGCIGGAVDMVTACDMRYATENAFFCVQEINIGMTADVGTLQRLPKLIPEGVAREWAYTGDRIPAARAKEVGLVNEVYPDHDTMIAEVLAIAGRIAAKSPLAIWGTKESINYARDHSVGDAMEFIALWQSGMFQPADMMECFVAKSEGRDPAFDDLNEVRNPI
jgi:enoyl-CoA hydratase